VLLKDSAELRESVEIADFHTFHYFHEAWIARAQRPLAAAPSLPRAHTPPACLHVCAPQLQLRAITTMMAKNGWDMINWRGVVSDSAASMILLQKDACDLKRQRALELVADKDSGYRWVFLFTRVTRGRGVGEGLVVGFLVAAEPLLTPHLPPAPPRCTATPAKSCYLTRTGAQTSWCTRTRRLSSSPSA
jgi:hypothetical protein